MTTPPPNTAWVASLVRYPIKGFTGQRLLSATLRPEQGLAFDRTLAISNGIRATDPDGGWTPCEAFVRLTKNIDLPRYRMAFAATPS